MLLMVQNVAQEQNYVNPLFTPKGCVSLIQIYSDLFGPHH